ncbi:trafficking protein particle complex subunit 2-like protein, partial [Trifolium pratense]
CSWKGLNNGNHRLFHHCAVGKVLTMATTACFIIVSRNDIPIYEAEVGVAAKREDAAQLHQFILHAALDVVQDLAWTTSAMYLKSVDRFNELVVSVYVTAGHILYHREL